MVHNIDQALSFPVTMKGMLPSSYERPASTEELVFSFTDGQPFADAQVKMRDARALQAKYKSTAAFFAEHGFALVKNDSKVKDWSKDGDDVNQYFSEAKQIVRDHIFPNQSIEVECSKHRYVRRGPGEESGYYVSRVHSDYAWTTEQYAETENAFSGADTVSEWRADYDKPEHIGFKVLNFWRTCNMKKPLVCYPLAVTKLSTIENKDVIAGRLQGVSKFADTPPICVLRHQDTQEWYYYPRMRSDEVLVLQLFEAWKGKDPTKWHSVYHSSFSDPDGHDDMEQRQSCELRVRVFYKAEE